MFKAVRSLIVLMLLVSLLPVTTVMAQGSGASVSSTVDLSTRSQLALPPNCELGLDPNGSQTLICVPTAPPVPIPTLVIFAHGYVWPFLPEKAIPWDQMFLADPTNPDPNATPIFVADMVTNMGFYFATTSYRANGLVVQDAIQDLLLVREKAIAKIQSDFGMPVPVNVILTGVSEGGLITTLSVERYADKYSGGLAMCGPIGDFRKEINYWGDFRSLFDVYYSDLKAYPPGTGSTTISIPPALMLTWAQDAGGFRTSLMAKVLNPANMARTQDLLKMASVPPEALANPLFMQDTILNLLNYNIFATMNGQAVLGGNPFDNRTTVYLGSTFFPNINGKVANYKASEIALANLAPYQTSGQLTRPLVVLHTTGDPVVPFWHATIYQSKEAPAALFKLDKIERYGHCAFTPSEVLGAFDELTGMIMQQLP